MPKSLLLFWINIAAALLYLMTFAANCVNLDYFIYRWIF